MHSLPVDILEAIIQELLGRREKATVKSLSLVVSSFTALCQRQLLSHLTISCSGGENNPGKYQRSTYATQKLLQSSPHLISCIRSLLILDSDGTSWTQLDLALLDILKSLTNLTSFTWESKFISSRPTCWNELPLPLQDAIRLTIRRPSLNFLSLRFADLTDLLNTTIVISPSLEHLSLRGTGRSKLTFKLTRSSIIACDDTGETIPSQLFITACKLERIEDIEIFFRWISAIQPHLSLERLDKLAVIHCAPTSPTTEELAWGPLLYHRFVQPRLEELWFDTISTHGSPTGLIYLDQLPSLQRLGLCLALSSVEDACNLISGIIQFFEVSNAVGITHLAFFFSFSATSLVLNPRKVPWELLDRAIAALPALRWVGIQVVDNRRDGIAMIPPSPNIMLPKLSDKGVLHWLTGLLEFPAV